MGFLIDGSPSTNDPNVFLVSSFMILTISELSSYLSALKGLILFLLLFKAREPNAGYPEAIVVLDLELIFCMVMAGLIVGIVLITHR